MALNNLITVEFTTQEVNSVNNKLDGVEQVIAPKAVNLSPEERQQYAKISYEMNVFVDKVRAYMTTDPTLIPTWLDVAEMDRDIAARTVLTAWHNKLTELLEMVDDTNILLSTDVYHSALAYYNNVKQASVNNVPGTTTIYQDLQQQFPGRPAGSGTSGGSTTTVIQATPGSKITFNLPPSHKLAVNKTWLNNANGIHLLNQGPATLKLFSGTSENAEPATGQGVTVNPSTTVTDIYVTSLGNATDNFILFKNTSLTQASAFEASPLLMLLS